VPATTTAAAGKAVFQVALADAFAKPNSAQVATAMDVAFATYATTVAAGMLGAGFTGIPPAAPVGFATLFLPPYEATHAAAAAKIGNRIHAWASTGAATLIAPPNTPTTWT
jgi:hypothetical protein